MRDPFIDVHQTELMRLTSSRRLEPQELLACFMWPWLVTRSLSLDQMYISLHTIHACGYCGIP